MVIILILALMSTLFYFNMIITEIFNSKFIYNQENNNRQTLNALVKFFLIILMSIFWGILLK